MLNSRRIKYGYGWAEIIHEYFRDGYNDTRLEKRFFKTEREQVTVAIFEFDLVSRISNTTTFVYDENDCLHERYENFNGRTEIELFKYDSVGRIVSIERRDENQVLLSKSYKTYGLEYDEVNEYAFSTSRDSSLTRKEITQYQNHRKKYYMNVNFFETRTDDPRRLQKATGVQYYYDSLGTSRIVLLREGEVVASYIVKFQ